MRKISVVAISIILSVSCNFALAAPHDDAFKAYDAGDFEAAVNIWRPMAEDGDARAQYWIGKLYTRGAGVAKDFAQARKWIEAAARQGHTKAEHGMGDIYRYGDGVRSDASTSFDWYMRAAKKGYALSELSLAELILSDENSSEERLRSAQEWLRSPAERGIARAQYFYGYLYMMGIAGTKDPALARKWFAKAAEQEYVRAQIELGDLLRTGIGGPVDYDASAKWFLRAVTGGDFDAWAYMGQLCAELKPQREYDHMFAKLWFLSGAKNGSKLAQSIVDNWGWETKQLVEVLLKRHKNNHLGIETDSYTPSCGMLPRS